MLHHIAVIKVTGFSNTKDNTMVFLITLQQIIYWSHTSKALLTECFWIGTMAVLYRPY